MRVKLKKVPNLRSIRVSQSLGCGREIQYKSVYPADFDMNLGHFNCEDLLYIFVFIPWFKYLKFIY